MKLPKSVETNFTNHNEESSYKFLPENTDQIKTKCGLREGNILKFDNLLTKRSILFNFTGDSHLSDHILKLDFYAKHDHEILTREDILEYRNKMMNKCEVYRTECQKIAEKNEDLQNKNIKIDEDFICNACYIHDLYTNIEDYDHSKTCRYSGKTKINYSDNEKEIKIINLLKEYVIDLKYLFAKISLEDKEVEIFDKIILWMHSLFVKLSEDDKELIFTRLSNEFYDLDYSYIVVINFLKVYFKSIQTPS